MANSRISSLTSLGGTPNTADIIPITDVSDTTGSAQGTTKKVTVANLISAAPQGDLLASNNLSDVANAGTSRTNLGLGTAATLAVGTSATNVVQLADVGGTVKLPAVDGSQLTGISTTDSTKLAIASNLSDLNNAATARTNLGLGTAATTASTAYATATQGATADSALQSVSAGELTDGNFDGTAILGFDATLNDQTDNYTLQTSDAGKVVVMNKGSAVNLTVPASLGAGFTCSVVQKGAGQVTFVASSTTINNRQTHTKIAGQHGVATLISTADNVFVLAGDTAS